MKARSVILAILASLALAVGAAGPAAAAGSYGGPGATVNITNYNVWRTSFLPAPPSSVPTTSVITSVDYTMNVTRPGFAPGFLEAEMCTTLTNCTPINQFGGSTSFFNGLPADTTSLQIRVRWVHPTAANPIPGGVIISNGITVNYS